MLRLAILFLILGLVAAVLGFGGVAGASFAIAKTLVWIFLAIFVRVEARTEYPLIRVRIFRDRAFSVDNGVLFLSMIAFVPVFFFASVYSQVSLGYTSQNAGLYLLTFFGGFAPGAQVGGRMLDSGGARRP